MMYYNDASSFDAEELYFILTHPEYLNMVIPKHIQIRGNRICRKQYDITERPYYFEFSVDGVPSQCGMVMMYATDFYRMDKEKFEPVWRDIEDIFKALRYSSVMVTLNATQESSKEKFEHVGFKEVFTWMNKRSNNQCYQLVKKIDF